MADDYITQMHKKLEATRKRLRSGREMAALKSSAPSLFEVIDGEISLAVNRMNQDKPLSYEEYLSAHGEVKMAKRIRDVIDAKEVEANQAQQEVQAIEENIELVKNEQKQNQS